MPHCNAANFQVFLEEFSQQHPTEYKIIILDNGAFHKAKSLKIPDNIILVFLPPYSPELNPAENMWAQLKRKFTNRLFKTLDSLSEFIASTTKTITNQKVKTTCSFSYIFEGTFWTNV
jgi:transposase